jgi:hypothetical protein
MVNYENSKIYKIEPIVDHDEGDIYIGSTTKNYLSQRMDKHRSDYKRWKEKGKGGHIRSYDLFEKYGIDNCQILLIESFPCLTKDELRAREGHHIRTLKCVNKNIAGRSYKEYQNLYYENNSDKIKEKQKLYYENNLDTINENKKKILLCVCGCNYTRTNYSQHCKSKKHESYINSQNIILDV